MSKEKMFSWVSRERALSLIDEFGAENSIRISDGSSDRVYKYAYLPWVVYDLISSHAWGYWDYITGIFKLEPGSYIVKVQKKGIDYFWIDVTHEGKSNPDILLDSFPYDFLEEEH